MADGWHYSVQGDRHGPVSSAELKRLADAGQLSPSDLVWKQGLANWVAASSVKGLFTGTVTPPPLPPRASTSFNADESRPTTGIAARAVIQSISTGQPIAGFHIQRAAFGLAAVLGALTTFMPWATAPVVGTVYGTAGDGWLTLLLFLPAVVIACLGNRRESVDGWKQFAAAVPAATAGLFGLYKIVSLNLKMSELRADRNPFAKALALSVQVRFGLYLLVVAGVATAVAVFILRYRSQKAGGLQ